MTKNNLLPCLVLSLTAFGIYAGTLEHSFTFDDHHYIVESDYIKGWKPFLSAFFSNHFLDPEKLDITRPLMSFSLMLDYAVWGLNPAGYHLTNIILHLLNAVLLFIITSRIVQGWAPITAALLFTVHPVHVEAVAGITFREDLLVTLFYLLSLLFYMRLIETRKLSNCLLSLLFFLFALLSKEMAATLPLMLLAYNLRLEKENRKKGNVYYTFPYWLILSIYLIFIYNIYSTLPSPPVFANNLFVTVFTALKALAIDIGLILFPINLHIDYNVFPAHGLIELPVLTAIFIIIFFMLYVLKGRDKEIIFCISFFFITIIPVLNIIPTFRLVADRFLYLPSAGVCALFSILLFRMKERHADFLLTNQFLRSGMIFLMLLYAALTICRNGVWQNDSILWSDVLKKAPTSVRAHVAIGSQYLKKGSYDRAIPMLQRAISLRPDYDKSYYNLGIAYMKKGDSNRAISLFKKALEIAPAYAKARFNLGLALAKIKRYDEAIIEYEKAVDLMPNNAVLYNNLGNVYSEKELYGKAESSYSKAISIDANYAMVYYNLGNLYVKRERYDLAMSEYSRAKSIDPTNASIHYNLGNIYLLLGQEGKAMEAYKDAIAINPEHKGAVEALKLIDKEKSDEGI